MMSVYLFMYWMNVCLLMDSGRMVLCWLLVLMLMCLCSRCVFLCIWMGCVLYVVLMVVRCFVF